MRRVAALFGLGLAACGDNLPPPPLSAGPVSIDTATMTLTLASEPAMVQAKFLAVRTVERVIDTTYYDPLDAHDVRFETVDHAESADGDWLVLEHGLRLRLTECAIPRCAVLELDASHNEKAVQVLLALPRESPEPLYGTGDAAEHADVVDTTRDMSIRGDRGSDSKLNESHVPVPLVLWPRRGAGMFVADDRPGALDLAKAFDGLVTATFNLPERGTYRVYLFTAEAPLDLVRTYTALTAKPAVPPRWALAPQHGRAWASSAELLADMTRLRAAHMPGSAIWLEGPWQTAYSDFVVDEQRLAGIDAVIADLTAHGYKVLFSSAPYVGAGDPTGRSEGIANDYFVTGDGGNVIDWLWQHGPGALVDFTRDGATAWWRERIARVVGRGAAGFELGFGEDLVPDVDGVRVPFVLAAGDSSTHHNRYAQSYGEAYLGAFPPGEGFVLARGGAWGGQAASSAIWSGGLDSDFRAAEVTPGGRRFVGGLASAISRGLSLSLSGYPFHGAEIGGSRGAATTELVLRWIQAAALGTIMRIDPARITAETEAVYKTYAELHMALNPLLWTLALQAGTDGTPILRPVKFMYDCQLCDDALFLVGDDILVAPVIQPGATSRNMLFPPGHWLHRGSNRAYSGDHLVDLPTLPPPSASILAPVHTIPLFFRAESLVPMFARTADTLLPATAPGVTSYADPAYGRELRLVYTTLHEENPPSASASLHDGARATARATRMTVTGGTEYTVFTFDMNTFGIAPESPYNAPVAVSVDGVDLNAVTSEAELQACAAPGCWWHDVPAFRFQARVFAPTGQTRTIVVR